MYDSSACGSALTVSYVQKNSDNAGAHVCWYSVYFMEIIIIYYEIFF